jgi:hypothetical protein
MVNERSLVQDQSRHDDASKVNYLLSMRVLAYMRGGAHEDHRGDQTIN